MRISYAITVCNEFVEIQKLISFLLENKREEDEIIVLYDSNKGTQEVLKYLEEKYQQECIKLYKEGFENHFGNWKNKLKSYCTGKYIFQIDADEIPSKFLIDKLPIILEANISIEAFLVPRVNTVDNITKEHIEQWRWNISKLESMVEEKELDLRKIKDVEEYNLLKHYNLIIEETDKTIKYYKPIINWCDFQWRIWRNLDDIKWVHKVHERLEGFKTFGELPYNTVDFALYHPKTIERQEKQNKYYDTL